MNFTTRRMRSQSAFQMAALLGTASFLAMAASGPASAQGQVQPAAQQQAQAQGQMVPEQVLITGSLISGTAAVGVPVSDLRPVDFIETGKLSLTEILKTVPSLRIDAEASPTYGGGTLSFLQNVSIHGQGTGSGVETLLLVNGLRWPPQNYSNDTVNPSIIPQIALERIDVLSAGASAVYGSDATAGVINLILRRGYDGAMTQVSVTSAPSIGFLSEQFSQLYGKSWEGGNVTLSYAITDSRPLSASKRSYYTQDFTPWGLMDITPIGSSIPGIAHSGNSATIANAPALETSASGTRFCANCFSIPAGQNGVGLSWASIAANSGVKNERNPWIDSDARPRLQTNQVTGTFDQQLTNDFYGFGPISLFADGFYSNQRGKQVYTPGNGQARNVLEANLTVPTTNPYYPTGTRCTTNPSTAAPNGVPAGCTPTNLRVDYSLALEVPTIITGGEVATHWDFGLNLDRLPFDWTGKLTYSMSDDRNYGDASNSINKNNLLAALGNTVASTATSASFTKPSNIPYFNVFCDPTAFTCNDPTTLRYIVGYRLQHESWKIQEAGFNFNGPVFDLPGGPLKFAIAGQSLRQHWTYQNLENDNTDSTAIIQNAFDAGWQYSYAFFGQADIPIFGAPNAIPFFESLVVELGYRYDKYNYLPDPVWTPKAAINWTVGEGLTLRGSWGKSFRVASFAENSPFGSRVAGQNRLGGFSNSTNVTVLDCSSVNGSPSGVAIPGSLTAVLNPTCLTDEAHVSPGGISVELSGNGAAALLRGHALSPESTRQWSTGFNFAPTTILGVDLSGLNIDVSWFRLEYKGPILSNSLGRGGNDPVSFSRYTVIPRPDLPITAPENKAFFDLVTALSQVPQRSGFTFDAVNIPNIKFIQDTALTNLGSRVVSGIDFDARYDFDLNKVGLTNMGALNFGAAGYYQTILKDRGSDASPVVHTYEGKDSGNRLQRVRYRLGWSDETWSVTAFANYFGHGAAGNPLGVNFNGNDLIPPCFYSPTTTAGSCFAGSPHYGPYTVYPNMSPATVYFDLSIGYQTGEMPANTYLRNIGVQLTVNDIFDKPPPFQVGARGNGSIRAFDNAFPDLQRTFTLTLTKTW